MRPQSDHMDRILGKEFGVLNKGFVRVVDYMGDQGAIVQAARVSYGEGTETPSTDRSLIRYLMRHRHTTPFEMVELKLHLRMPFFVARQWHRHRTASINEVSGRYSLIPDDVYVPELEEIGRQSTSNKQGTGEGYDDETAEGIARILEHSMEPAHRTYRGLIETQDLAREMARIVLPMATYTEFYWKIDLHNLLHFLDLRMHPHAQAQIRDYAEAIFYCVVEPWLPVVAEAFTDYVTEAHTFSGPEMRALRAFIGSGGPAPIPKGVSKRELKAFHKALGMETDDA